MIIESYLSNFTQPLFDRLGKILMSLHVTPNILTFIGLISGILCGICIGTNNIALAFSMLIVSGMCDILDGTIARLSHTAQKIGSYLDAIADRLVEAAIILGFAFLYPSASFAFLMFLAAVLFQTSTFLVAATIFATTGKKHPFFEQKIISRVETFLTFALMLAFEKQVFEIMIVFNLIIVTSGINRFFKVLLIDRELKLARKKKKVSDQI